AADAPVEDLDDEARREPGGGAQVGVGVTDMDRGRLAATAGEPWREIGDQGIGESGAHPAGIAPAMFGVGTGEQQRAESASAAAGRGIPHRRELVAGELLGLAPATSSRWWGIPRHRELVAGELLGLAPVVAAARPIRLVGPL